MTDFAVVSDVIKSNSEFFSRWGFRFESEKKEISRVNGDRMTIEYISKTNGRSIHLIYHMLPHEKTAQMSLFVHIRRYQSFDLCEYFHDQGKLSDCEKFFNTGMEKPVKEFCEEFMSLVRHAFENDLADLLNNESWSVKPYDWRDEY